MSEPAALDLAAIKDQLQKTSGDSVLFTEGVDFVAALVDELEHCRAALEIARDALDHCGWGDMHYGPTPREPRVVNALAEIAGALGEVTQ